MSDNLKSYLSNEEMQILAEVRAQFSAFLASFFLSLPDGAFVEPLRSAEFSEALAAIQAGDDLPEEMIQGAGLMQRFLEEQQDASLADLAQTLGVDRTRLYRGVSPTYGPPPPYEAVWSGSESGATTLLQTLARTYQESGLAQAPDARERPDYIGVELGYLETMAAKEAGAWQSGDEVSAREAFERQRAFLIQHLAWVPAFIDRALQDAKTDFYRGHLLMLGGFLSQEQAFFSQLLK